MLPEEAPPPGLAEMFGGMPYGVGPDEEPDEIDVVPPDAGGGEQSDEELITSAIEALQQAMQNASDDADSAELAKVVQTLYRLKAGNQDAAMQAMGGNPKQMRAMQKAAP